MQCAVPSIKPVCGFRVEDSVHLSILQFAKFPLWKDLDESWKELSRNSLVTHLIQTPNERYTDPVTEAVRTDLDELGTAVPVPADASQLRAIAEAVGGRTFVRKGPPGTGKSQTITNLLAHAMSTGRRVLFVAEKRAALDVVKKRLEVSAWGNCRWTSMTSRPGPRPCEHRSSTHWNYGSAMTATFRTKIQVAESSRRSLARYAERFHEVNAAAIALHRALVRIGRRPGIAPLDVPRELVANGSAETFDVVGRGASGASRKIRPRSPK